MAFLTKHEVWDISITFQLNKIFLLFVCCKADGCYCSNGMDLPVLTYLESICYKTYMGSRKLQLVILCALHIGSLCAIHNHGQASLKDRALNILFGLYSSLVFLPLKRGIKLKEYYLVVLSLIAKMAAM